MAKKQFKTESKKLLDMMINSIYTHKEIFLRELIANASDACDKLHYRSLTDASVTLARGDYEIRLTADKAARTLTITDNGCGMTKEELENNLGTIAKSGSYDFKQAGEGGEEVDIIGQFGVGFYSAFMVSDKIEVTTKPYGTDEAWLWVSEGADGYTIDPAVKAGNGTTIVLHIKPDTEEEKYSEYLDAYRIEALVKKYNDYIRYPIRMMVTREELKEGTEDTYETVTEDKTLNSMVPIWKKNQSEVDEEAYAAFYREKFYDWEPPLKVIRQRSEGGVTYEALLFIPQHAPYDFYTKEYERGLELYSSGVMIMEKCKELLPDYFGFVRGLVDSADLSLNISREMLQHDRQVRAIAKALEKKITGELGKLRDNERAEYETFWAAFGMQIKYGVYADYGAHKDTLKDLLLFNTSADKQMTLAEYVEGMGEGQSKIYYACGETADKVALLPQVETVVARGYTVLYLTDDIDEFALQVLREYADKPFANVCTDALDTESEEERERVKLENEKNAEILTAMKEALGDDVVAVRFTASLGEHPVCLTSEGALSIDMEKVLGRMPGNEGGPRAQMVLEINISHPIAAKVKELYVTDRALLADYTKILYAQARLISGLAIDNPSELADMICKLMV